MALNVNFTDSGVQIENLIRQTNITLAYDAWENLIGCSQDVKKAIAEKKVGDWMLDADKNIRVSTSILNKAVYIHVREWYKEHITKVGISFYERDWDALEAHFAASEEMKLGKKVMTTLVRKEMKKLVPEACEGCCNSYPSQKDHDCLMNPGTLGRRVMDKVDIKPQDFILVMAKEAAKEGVVLERPNDTFKRIKRFHLQAIKDSVIDTDFGF